MGGGFFIGGLWDLGGRKSEIGRKVLMDGVITPYEVPYNINGWCCLSRRCCQEL